MGKKYSEYILSVLAEKAYDTSLFSKNSPNTISIEYRDGMFNQTIQFEIIDSTKGYDFKRVTGFNALAFREIGTDDYVVSFRGTDAGFSLSKLVPMALDLISDIAEVVGLNPQIPVASRFVQNLLDRKDLSISKDNITLTGHSLGGILSNHVSMSHKIKTTAFNALGLMEIRDGIPYINGKPMSEEDTEFAKNFIRNVRYSDARSNNGDFLSYFLTNVLGRMQLGESIDAGGDLGKGLSATGVGNSIEEMMRSFKAHGIGKTVEFAKDQNRIWSGEDNYQLHPSELLKAVSLNLRVNPVEKNRALDLSKYQGNNGNTEVPYYLPKGMTNLFPEQSELEPSKPRNINGNMSPYSRTINMLERFLRGNPNAKPVSLENISISEMIEKAQNDPAYAYALQEGNGFALEGSIFLPGDMPEKVSDPVLRDRARNIYVSLLSGDSVARREKTDVNFEKMSLSEDKELIRSLDQCGLSDEPHLENIAKAIVMDRRIKNPQDHFIVEDVDHLADVESKLDFLLDKNEVSDHDGLHTINSEIDSQLTKDDVLSINLKRSANIKRNTLKTILSLSEGKKDAQVVSLGYFSKDELLLCAENDTSFRYALDKENGSAVVGGNYDDYTCTLTDNELAQRAEEILSSINVYKGNNNGLNATLFRSLDNSLDEV